MKDHVTFAYLLNSAIISFSHRTSWVTRVSYNKKITKEIFFSVSKETSLIFVLTLSGKEWWNVGKENFCRAIFKTPAGRRKRKQYKGNCKAFCVRRKPKNLKFILLWEDSRNSRKMFSLVTVVVKKTSFLWLWFRFFSSVWTVTAFLISFYCSILAFVMGYWLVLFLFVRACLFEFIFNSWKNCSLQ